MPGCSRDFRRVVSVRRCGAGGIFQCLQDPADHRRADPVAEFQQFALDPLVPPLFSVASRSISAAISALTGGRPVRLG